MIFRRLLIILPLALGAVLAAVTLVALEGSEVVVIQTVDDAGALRSTRTWIADEDGDAWIEAANAERPFLRDIRERPAIALTRGQLVLRCHATPSPNPEGHARIRRLLAQKYGWADAWIGMLTDTSGSLAVRLECGDTGESQSRVKSRESGGESCPVRLSTLDS